MCGNLSRHLRHGLWSFVWLGLCLPASGSIISSTGAVTVIAPPSDVRTGQFESDTNIWTFAERQNFTLPSSIPVDITLPGTSPGPSDANLSPGTIAAGTNISSYFLHYDIVGSPTPPKDAIGSITFSTDVLGIDIRVDSLNATNAMPGLSSVTYATGDHHGIEFNGGPSFITLSADRRTVSFELEVTEYCDDIRVITATVPEPKAWLTAGIGAAIAFLFAARSRLYGVATKQTSERSASLIGPWSGGAGPSRLG